METLRDWQADLFVVAAYGQILPKAVLELPRLGCINVHASLLPKYRGATPIHAAILNGDAETGVTIIKLEPKVDAGPILGVGRTLIGKKETTGELEGCLAQLAVPLTLRVIGELENGTARPVEQDEAQASRAGKLTKDNGWIPWQKSAVEVDRHVRGMQPWPGPFTMLIRDDRPPLRIKILEVLPVDDGVQGSSGTISLLTKDSIRVHCGRGEVFLTMLQPDGKRPMTTSEFLRGHLVRPEDRFARNERPT
jgi:methionyl-tRNA formyltransferase